MGGGCVAQVYHGEYQGQSVAVKVKPRVSCGFLLGHPKGKDHLNQASIFRGKNVRLRESMWGYKGDILYTVFLVIF